MKIRNSYQYMFALLAIIVLGITPVEAAKYSADIQMVPNLKAEVRVLAVAPAKCPPHIDCLWLEQRISRELQKYGFTIVTPTKVKQALFELDADLSASSIDGVLKALEADALLRPTVGHSGKEGEGGVGVVSGGAVLIAVDEKKTGQVSVLVVGRDGQQLLSGKGYGRSGNDLKSQKGVVLKIFQKVFSKAFK